jgi:tRNA modification GTPase
MNASDTIVAISSAVGPAARVILRVSGPLSRTIATSFAAGHAFSPNAASRHQVAVGGVRFPAWLYSFASPRSYTGEDLLELHLPGNEVLARLTFDHILTLGARPAEPGEFTARAYFNGRMDLTAAEGVAAAVSASNEDELRAARQLMAGALAQRLRPLMDRIAETLGLVEVGIDFSEEDVTFLPTEELHRRAADVESELAKLVSDSDRLERLSAEPTVVLVGRPNAGKSTLLNTLAGTERAVVSPVAGTTRDVLSAEVALPRGLVRLVDAAGIDAPGGDEIAQSMRRRALDAVQSADVLVLAIDAADTRPPVDPGRDPDLVIRTKSDQPHPRTPDLHVSALTGQGLDSLRARLDALAFGRTGGGERLALNRRHLQNLDDARAALRRARDAGPVEVAAMELREALDSLGNVLGVISPDDVLGLVFSRFCIGK